VTGARTQRKRRNPVVRVLLWIAPLVLVVLLAIGALVLSGSVGPTALEKAAEACSVGENTVAAVDDGTSLTVESGDDRTGWQATIMSVCVLTELEVSDPVMEKVAATKAASDEQSDTWDDFVVTWTYSPRDGLEIVVEMGKSAVDDFQRA
jgi:hypothetical protein